MGGLSSNFSQKHKLLNLKANEIEVQRAPTLVWNISCALFTFCRK
jgi:hypothetical protein